jgi:AcrR family transcriptional regulator
VIAVAGVVSHRDRQRSATEAEIKQIARRQLAASGEAPTLRAIARDLGMTAPGLYRYFSSLGELLAALTEDFFAEANEAVISAMTAAGDDSGPRMHAAVRAFRAWAVAHPAEFRLMFQAHDVDGLGGWGGTQPADAGADRGSPAGCVVPLLEAPRRFGELFMGLFVALWQAQPFDPPAVSGPAAASCVDLAAFARKFGIALPERALWVFANAWIRLYGVICMEVLGQLSFMFADVGPYFEAELEAIAGIVGVRYMPLADGRAATVPSETITA